MKMTTQPTRTNGPQQNQSGEVCISKKFVSLNMHMKIRGIK